MNLFEIAYTLATLVALGACIPQLVSVIKKKETDEFNISTWVLWMSTQSASFVYAVSLNNPFLIAANGGWVVFYSAMVAMIIYFNRRNKLAIQTAPAE